LLDWTKIDNEKTFQRLLNHLFSIECNSPDFIPSSPYIGFDEGWDGFWEGYYPREKACGVWSIQAKWTTKSFNDAFNDLKALCRKELIKSKKNNVNFLRIGTNAELRVNHVRELQELNDDMVDDFKIWHRERLSFRIEKQPFIRFFYFGQPKFPMLIPSSFYFSENEPNLNDSHCSLIKRFSKHLEDVQNFLTSEKDILIIRSNSSDGKSHLMRDISSLVPATAPERQTWAINPGYRNVFDAIQDEISHENKYLLLFDDAHRYLNEIRPILSFIRRKRDHVKIIFSCRSSGYEQLYNLIQELRCENLYDVIDLPDWTDEELIKLLRSILKRDFVENENEIVRSYANPFLISWIGKKINQENGVEFDKLKETIINKINNDAILSLDKKYDSDFITKLLVEIAFIVPFYLSDNKITSTLSEYLKIKVDIFIEIIKKYIEIGILRYVGNSIRFNPDIVGDLYFADYCSKIDEAEKFEKMMIRWYAHKPENMFSNIELSSRYYNSEVIKNILEKVVFLWIGNVNDQSIYVKQFQLKLAYNLAFIIPESVLNLIASYLDINKKSMSSSKLNQREYFFKNLTTDDFGPIIIKLLHIPQLRKSVINLILKMSNSCIEGTYDNYKPMSLIKYSVSPLSHNYKTIMTTLNLFDDPLLKKHEYGLHFIASAVNEILAGRHEYISSSGMKISFGHRYLNKTDEIVKIREKGYRIILGLLESEEIAQIIAGIKIIGNIGITVGDLSIEEQLPLGQIIFDERNKSVKVLGQMLLSTSDYRISSKIETMFLEWWSKNIRGTNDAAQYLSKFDRPEEYLIYKYYTSPDFTIEDFDEMQENAPLENRWRWFIDSFMNRHRDREGIDFDPLVNYLQQTYNDENSIASYLQTLEKLITYEREIQYNPPIIDKWIASEIELFTSIRNDLTIWRTIPDIFKEKIDYVISTKDNNFISIKRREILESLSSIPIDVVITYLNMVIDSDMSKEMMHKHLVELIDIGSSTIIELTTRYMTLIMLKYNDGELIFDIISYIFDNDKMQYSMINNIALTLNNLKSKRLKINDEKLGQFNVKMINYLKNMPNLDWYSQEILEFSLSNVNEVLDFLTYRLSKPIAVSEESVFDDYRAIPFEGFSFIQKKVDSYEKFEFLVDGLLNVHHNVKYIHSHDFMSLLKDISNKIHDDTQKTYIVEYFNRKFEKNNLIDAVEVLNYIDFTENNVPLFLSALNKCEELDQIPYLESILSNIIHVKEGFSTRSGEPPKVYVDIKNNLMKMKELAEPGLVKSMIGESIKSVEKTIQFHLNLDDEIINRRR